jgi:predicted DNA-binding transcriptional regulator AlpA
MARQTSGLGHDHDEPQAALGGQAWRAPMLDPILSIAEIAKLLGVSIATVRRGIRAGSGPRVVQLSPRRIGVRHSDFQAHLEGHLRRPESK